VFEKRKKLQTFQRMADGRTLLEQARTVFNRPSMIQAFYQALQINACYNLIPELLLTHDPDRAAAFIANHCILGNPSMAATTVIDLIACLVS